jgi:CRISPR-associated protein Csb2
MIDDAADVFLKLTCKLTEGHFLGIRLNASGKEESDWPPAPSRVFQALVHATLAGLPVSEVASQRQEPLRALEWLERLAAPEIQTQPIAKSHRDKFQLALPLNNMAKGTNLLAHSLQLAPVRRVSVYDMPSPNDLLEVTYLWKVPSAEAIPIHDLEEMAARVSYFGRAEDRAMLAFEIIKHRPNPLAYEHQWIPSSRGFLLGTPRSGTLQSLQSLHALSLPPRVRPPTSSSCFTIQAYRSASTLELQQPVFTGIIRLVDVNDDVLSFDPLDANRQRAHIRRMVCQTSQSHIKWADERYAGELISGHDAATGQPTKMPHLAIVPVPSLNRSGVADGSVRRFALIGYAASGQEARAEMIYQTLFRNLHGRELIHDGKATGQWMSCVPSYENDKVWGLFTGCSSRWATVFPATISSKFDVPKSLKGNERHHRITQEVSRLIRKALIRQGLPEEAAMETSIAVSATPFLTKTHRAEHYGYEGKSYRSHLNLSFPCEVLGPLIIGDGRYSGMGLCFPL